MSVKLGLELLVRFHQHINPILHSIMTFPSGIGALKNRVDIYDILTCAADRGMTFWDCAHIYGNSMSVSSFCLEVKT
jgi:aryl-alcohol dehydrogenase-like predicted oxidoreductase